MCSDFCKKSEQAICSLLRRGTIRQIYYLDRYLRHWAANPAQRIAAESEEKARPAYEKALRPFHRLRAFSELSGGFNPDILPWNPCTATACKFPAKNTRNFFEVLLTLFEPPAEFNADITRPAFGTHPAAILASVLLLSADR